VAASALNKNRTSHKNQKQNKKVKNQKTFLFYFNEIDIEKIEIERFLFV
jgi:hypothetical protein